jgi:transcriptional regulator with XRE-family HTH domain
MSRPKSVPPSPRARRTHPNLLTWRLKTNLNQREAALILGFTQSKYCRIERGLKIPVRGDARRIVKKTGVPLERLIGVA